MTTASVSSVRRVRWGIRLVLYPLLLGLIAFAWHRRQHGGYVHATTWPPPMHFLETADGRVVDMTLVGTFELMRSSTHGLDIQMLTVPEAPGRAVLRALAMRVHGHRVELTTTEQARIDGRPVFLASHAWRDLGDGAWVQRIAHTYTVVWPGDGWRPKVTMTDAAFSIAGLPQTGDHSGPFGATPDGRPGDDLIFRDGRRLAANAGPRMVQAYLESWRVTPGTSLFTTR